MNSMELDNHDERICYYELLLERDLDRLPDFKLPEGFRFVFYQPGDRDRWIDIEKSAKEFTSYEQGLRSWNRYYETRQEELPDRMVFVENESGEKVATATALYDINGKDLSGDGWLHWVAVRRDYQGRGLSKPMIVYVLHVMKRLGYHHAKIPTQTNTWLACKVYLDLGFLPLPQNKVHSCMGWRIVKTLTEHPVLSDLERVSADEILKGMEIVMNYEMIRLEDRPELMERAAEWFHKKWGIPLAAYKESMEECLTGEHVVPQWYVTLEGTRIIGGMGVIENDFHDRKDLAPNVCAVYTEEDKRGQGVAGQLLDFVCRDMRSKGIDTLYLVTDHTSFYERYGWEFLCMVQGDGEEEMSRMYVHTRDGDLL